MERSVLSSCKAGRGEITGDVLAVVATELSAGKLRPLAEEAASSIGERPVTSAALSTGAADDIEDEEADAIDVE